MTTDLEKQMKEAENRYNSMPNLENLIWYGRRVGYTGEFGRSIKIYTNGLVKYPDNPELLRHRGHRYISTKQFDEAVDDLEMAKSVIQGTDDRIEEDGMPNSRNIPLSTLHFNIYYHLGLAFYLKGNFQQAFQEFTTCLEVSKNDDSVIASKYWLYLISQRKDLNIEFIPPNNFENLQIIENFAYYYLLEFYLGYISQKELESLMKDAIDTATIGYGLAMYHYFDGSKSRAKDMLENNIATNHPAAFGTLASVVELQRLDRWCKER